MNRRDYLRLSPGCRIALAVGAREVRRVHHSTHRVRGMAGGMFSPASVGDEPAAAGLLAERMACRMERGCRASIA